jgi:hypothetical protein
VIQLILFLSSRSGIIWSVSIKTDKRIFSWSYKICPFFDTKPNQPIKSIFIDCYHSLLSHFLTLTSGIKNFEISMKMSLYVQIKINHNKNSIKIQLKIFKKPENLTKSNKFSNFSHNSKKNPKISTNIPKNIKNPSKILKILAFWKNHGLRYHTQYSKHSVKFCQYNNILRIL